MSGTELAVIDPASVEAAADPAQYVVQACERAKAWLADALEHGGIDEIVELKSQAEAIRIYTMQKQLGKDAELSAAEIVRRAERGLGLAIRKGQEMGEIAVPHEHAFVGNQHVRRELLPDEKKTSPTAFFNGGSETSATYAMADGVPDEMFDAAIDEAKAERNLSRANVVRKVRAKRDAQEAKEAALADPDENWVPDGDDRTPLAATRRREVIREHAGKGWSSQQLGELLGLLPDSVRRIARDNGIAMPADDALGRGTRKAVDSNRIVRETVNSLEGLEIALDLVRFDELDMSEIPNWTTSLATSIRVLNRLNKQLKEMVQ